MPRSSIHRLLPALLLALALGLLWLPGCACSASFYGASVVSVAFQEAKGTTDVQLRFKTHQADAMLLLAAGRTDYCLVILESGGLKVRINLGAGEAELTSPPGLRLNDLMWHEVSVQRTDAEMQLVVDTIHRTRLTIPGRFYELNIHFGVYVGGMGDFSELFLGNMESFRGCLENLTFNGLNIFKQARESSEQRSVHDVTWDCSPEFDAVSDRAYSFVENGAFLALPSMNARNGGTFSLDVKTQGNTSIVLYNGGLPSKSDVVALEMISGKPKLSVDKGNGVVELKSEVLINDGLWHHIDVRFSPSYLEINVDDHVANVRPSLGENRHFDLAGKLYIGGIELNKQARALAHGLESMMRSDTHDGSFKGCIHNVHINAQLMGLREAEITKGIQVDCVWEYPCLRDPCVHEATCLQQGINGFRCLCDQPICMKPDLTTGYKLYTKSTLPGDQEILQLQPLQVKEGGKELVTSNNIDVILDFQKYEIRESGVLFHVIHHPEHGKLQVEIWRRPDESIFTLLDITTDKVEYVHDGSENHQDSIMMEVEFIVRRDRVPEYLTQRHRFVLSVIVSAINDPPELKLPPGRVIRLAQNTKKVLGADILSATDNDNGPGDLVYSILTPGSETSGYIENLKNPGVPVDSFTQSDVNNGFISYVHRGAPNTRVAFRVSDGIETGQTTVLRIAAFDLQLYMVNNTGLLVTYNSFSFIFPENLTFTTNAIEQELDIRYDITRPSQYGNVQRLRNNGRWQTVNHFTQRQMTKDKLRYIHTSGQPSHDDFKFTVSCNDIITPNVYDFRIIFQAIELHVVNNNELLLDRVQDRVIGMENLKVETLPHPTPVEEIVYTVVDTPAYGNLYLYYRDHRREKLESGSNFTQEQVDQNYLRYKLRRQSYSSIHDHFLFRVITPNDKSDTLQFNVRHLPGDTDAMITIERIEVEEGSRAVLTSHLLHLETPTIKEILFNITRLPKYGRIELVPTGKDVGTPTSSFTSQDIKYELIAYVHDNSEHDRDSFTFLAVPVNEDHDFQYIGTMHVHVTMKNDNPPERVIDKVFQVVINGERLLTGDDLRYLDPDIDSQPFNIQYTRRGITNGALFHVSKPEVQVFQFTQKDLDDKQILFRHNGTNYGRTVLWVTDGQFYTTGIFEIRASDPFVTIVNNTGIMVKRGKRGGIHKSNLSVETNINAVSKDVSFLVSSAPSHGKLLVSGEPAHHFTLQDVEDGRVEYENDNTNTFQDSIALTAQIDGAKTEADIEIKIFPESYWEPLTVANNRTLIVDEGHVGTFDQSLLQVTHANVDPRDITYVVHVPPKNGYLEVENNYFGSEHQRRLSANIFDQAVINEGKLKYVQTHRNVSDDAFFFDVTNGVVQLTGLKFQLHIISKVILLKVKNITVEEGGKVSLLPNDVIILSRYATNQINEFEIGSPPMHGHLESALKPGIILNKFSPAMLHDGLVQFVHDGSETLHDSFSIIARIKESGRESLATPVLVLVEPINDEFPKVVNNTGLQVWEGSTTTLTRTQLAAVDEDSGAEDLSFLISSLRSGYLALKNDTHYSISNFTQVALNKERVVFIHTGTTGSPDGGFYFQVTDGVNIGSRQSFAISAKPISMELEINKKLYVFPKVRQTITSENLVVATNDGDLRRDIVFILKQKPLLGKILLEDASGGAAETMRFTQREINTSLVVYEHTKPFTDLTAADSFVFDAECLFAPPLRDKIFNIEISVLKINPEGLDRYIGLLPLVVQEGERVILEQKNLNTSGLTEVLSDTENLQFIPKIHLVFSETPEHGILVIDGENATVGTIITQLDVNGKKMEYIHDHSDTLFDAMVFSVYLDSTESGGTNVILLNITVNVTIEPVNDQPFELLTKSPNIEVVQGQIVQFTNFNLLTVDPDTSPNELHYDIISGPSNGKIVHGNDVQMAVSSFTQKDIDSGNLFYVHEGSDDTVTFTFKVSDGAFRPLYKVFNIYVVPLTLQMANQSAICIPQGTTAVYLKSWNLGAETNGNRSGIWYNVTAKPKHGWLLMHDEIVFQFQQNDIDLEQVLYMQLDMTVSEDIFSATVWNEEITLENQAFHVLVTPLLEQKEYNVPIGSKAVLTLAVLNSSLLAQHSSSIPVFTITRHPKHGALRWVPWKERSKRSSDESLVHNFTHDDLVKQRIYYEVTESAEAYSNDSFEFLLTATSVQPAYGKFEFALHPKGIVTPDLVTLEDLLAEKTSPVDHGRGQSPMPTTAPPYQTTTVSVGGGSTNIYTPQISNDHLLSHLLIIGVAVGVVLLGAIIIIGVKCHSRRRKEQQEKKAGAAKNGGPLGPHGRPECDQRPDILEQQSRHSDYLTDEVPSISSRSGPTSPKLRPALGGLRHEVTPLRATPSPSHDEEWMEISSVVPTCKVTPLGPNDPIEANETTLKYPYGMLEPPDVDEWGMYDQTELRFQRPANPMLRKNQYWV